MHEAVREHTGGVRREGELNVTDDRRRMCPGSPDTGGGISAVSYRAATTLPAEAEANSWGWRILAYQ